MRKFVAHGSVLLGSRHVRAVGHLLTGTAATVVLSLLSITLAARALGPQNYGVLAIILSLGQACERLISFQSWQPLIRYGATLDPVADRQPLRALLKFGLLLDLGGSLGAWAIATLLAAASHVVLGIAWPMVALAGTYLASLMFNFNGFDTAVFRLFGAFRLSAHLQVVTALLRLAGSAIACMLGAGLWGFILVWAITQAFGPLLNLALALRILRRHGIGGIARAQLAGIADRFPGLWRFTWGANLSLTIWASAQQLDTLIVGWLADPVSAGLFHIAKRVSRIVQQVGSQVEAVIYPELSRMWAAGRRPEFLRLLLQTEGVLAGFGAACWLGAFLLGGWAIAVTAGPHFAGAGPLLTVQILAAALSISGAASRAGLLAMGRQPAVLRTVLAASCAFYLSVAPLIFWLGAMGANVAHVLFGATWLCGLTLSLRAGLRAQPADPLREKGAPVALATAVTVS